MWMRGAGPPAGRSSSLHHPGTPRRRWRGEGEEEEVEEEVEDGEEKEMRRSSWRRDPRG